MTAIVPRPVGAAALSVSAVAQRLLRRPCKAQRAASGPDSGGRRGPRAFLTDHHLVERAADRRVASPLVERTAGLPHGWRSEIQGREEIRLGEM
jgi:hypothetical protein